VAYCRSIHRYLIFILYAVQHSVSSFKDEGRDILVFEITQTKLSMLADTGEAEPPHPTIDGQIHQTPIVKNYRDKIEQ